MKAPLLVRSLATVGVAALALTACGGGSSSGGSASKGPVVLGTSLSMTGPLGQFGVALNAGYEQLVADVNAGGGVSVGGAKRQLKLVVLDNRSDANTASQQTRELVLKDGAAAILGACTPPIIIPGALAAEKEKVPFVSSCSPVNAFRGGNAAGWNYAWDLFFDEQAQAKAVATGLAQANSSKKVALFTDSEPDGVAERGLYKAAAAAAGLTVVGDYTFPVGTTDFSSFIKDAKDKGAELVAGQMIPPDGIALWKQMKSLSFTPKQAFVAKASDGASWPGALGPLAEGTLTEGFWSPSTGKANSAALMGTLGTKFANSFSDLNIAVLGYTAANVATDAISTAGSTDPAKVNTAIGKTSKDYPLGTITFDSKHTAVTPYLLMQWQGGKIVQILPAASGVTLQDPGKGLS